MFKHNQWCSVLLLCVLVAGCLPQLHGAPSQGADKTTGSNPIVYKRYVRRHPGNNEIDYIEEVFEEFYMRHKPPARQLSEEELDLLIRCDFDPSLAECKKLDIPKPTRPPTISKSTTTTTTTPTQPPTRTTTPATTEDLPILPNVPTSDEAPYDAENANEYEDENENDNDIENEDYNDEEENEEAEEEVDANDYLNDI